MGKKSKKVAGGAAGPGSSTKKASAEVPIVTETEAVIVKSPLAKPQSALEKRIRNLEKRRQKLLQYGKDKMEGKELSKEQEEALSKLDDVEKDLKCFGEMQKDLADHAKRVEVAMQKVTVKEESERAQHENNLMATVFLYREVITAFDDSDVRQAFANGAGGLEKLTEEEVDVLYCVHGVLNPNLRIGFDDTILKQLAATAAHVGIAVALESDEKIIGEHTGAEVAQIVERVMAGGFFTLLPNVLADKNKQLVTDGDKLAVAIGGLTLEEEEKEDIVKEGAEAAIPKDADSEKILELPPLEGEMQMDSTVFQVVGGPPESDGRRGRGGRPRRGMQTHRGGPPGAHRGSWESRGGGQGSRGQPPFRGGRGRGERRSRGRRGGAGGSGHEHQQMPPAVA